MNLKFIAIAFLFSLIFSCKNGNDEKTAFNKISLEDQLENYYPKQGEENNLRAIEVIETLIIIDSTNAKYIFARGYCYAQLGFYEQSNEEMIKAKHLGYDQKKCLFNIIINLSEIGAFDKINIYLTELKAINSDKEEMDIFTRYLQLKKEATQLRQESIDFKRKYKLKKYKL